MRLFLRPRGSTLLPCILSFFVIVYGSAFYSDALAQSDSIAPAPAASARAFIAKVGRAAVIQLPARKLAPASARAAFQKLLRTHFDISGIGRRVFADNWKQASPEQRKVALRLYETWVTDGLMNLLSRHTGETFRVINSAAVKGARGVYMVGSEIRRPNGERVRVDWTVRPVSRGTGATWLITNLRTPDGGDLVKNHRAEFRLMLEQAPSGAKSSGLEYIIEELQIRTAPLD